MNELIFNKIISSINENSKPNVSIYGFGATGRLHYSHMLHNFNIINIYDKNFVGESIDGKIIKEFSCKEDNSIILIAATNEFHYMSIYDTLTSQGLKEYVDFFNIREYIPIFYYVVYKKLMIPLVHMAVTTNCTLNCKNCNMFIPYHKDHKTSFHENIDNLKKSVDDFFNNIDKVFKFVLLGGEPFLYKDLEILIDYIKMNYSDRIDSLEFFTNGSVIPNDNLLEKINKYNITLNISDYTSSVNYTSKLDLFLEKIKSFNIRYRISSNMNWVDFLLPYSNFKIEKEKIKEHMLNCSPAFKGLNDSKFYYCHIVWSAVKAGIIEEKSSDHIDLSKKLSEKDRFNLLKYFFGLPDEHYISLCEKCAGYGSDNKRVIKAGIQS